MLDNQRIKEAEANMRQFIAEELIKKSSFDQKIFATYVKNSDESLKVAEDLHNSAGSDLWIIVMKTLKRSDASRLLVGMFLFLVVFAAGCAGGGGFGSALNRDAALFFLINETSEPLDGAVFLDGVQIGNTANGSLVVSKSALSPGELMLVGVDEASGSEFSFRFKLLEADNGFDRMRLEVPLSEYGKEIFDASGLETLTIEKKIFRLANEERAKLGIKPLRWNDRIAEVAKAYSLALPAEGFHHTDTSGRDVKKRLAESGVVFIVANENLYFSGTIGRDTDLASAAIKGWLESPGHRATLLDRDGLYSDAGVGVHCERKECYVVINFAAVKQEQTVSLNKGWVTFHYLHNPGYNFASDEIAVRLEISASNPVNVYIVSDRDKYEELTSGNSPDTLMEFRGVTSVDEKLVAFRGQGVIVESPDSSSEVKLSLDFAQ